MTTLARTEAERQLDRLVAAYPDLDFLAEAMHAAATLQRYRQAGYPVPEHEALPAAARMLARLNERLGVPPPPLDA